MNYKEHLIKGLEKINITTREEKIDKLLLFMEIVIEENKKFNLTAITEELEFIDKHILDSATILKYIKSGSLLDIGSGAGFPGIVIKILNDDINITLMDSLNKRVNYLNETIQKLNLQKIKAIHARAEEIAKTENYREKFDYVTARAVAKMNVLSEYSFGFLEVGGSFIALKGKNIEEELKESKKALHTLGGEIKTVENINLPYSLHERNIIIIKKLRKTPDKYPRNQRQIKKNPL